MSLSRRTFLALPPALAVVGIDEAEAKPKPEPFNWDDSEHTDTRHCPFCGGLLGSKTARG